MVNAAIVGGSGYTGVELLRLLTDHPEVEVTAVTSRQAAGRGVADLFPSLAACPQVFVEPGDPAVDSAEYVFTALPHKAAMETIVARRAAGQKVIDLSADFRFRDAAIYQAHYVPHIAPEMTASAVYGLAEIYADRIREAELIGNPGCYPTCSLLPLIPLLREGLVDAEGIIINAVSGVSGAGRKAAVGSLMSEAGEDFKAYGLASHRHRPEIEQELSLAAGRKVEIVFTPHLAPMVRGMLATIYVRPLADVDTVYDCWQAAYGDQPFISILASGTSPRTVGVRGSNCCHMSACPAEHGRTIILTSAIDNLTKGAAGQAIQCLNLMAGLDQTLGLSRIGMMP